MPAVLILMGVCSIFFYSVWTRISLPNKYSPICHSGVKTQWVRGAKEKNQLLHVICFYLNLRRAALREPWQTSRIIYFFLALHWAAAISQPAGFFLLFFFKTLCFMNYTAESDKLNTIRVLWEVILFSFKLFCLKYC